MSNGGSRRKRSAYSWQTVILAAGDWFAFAAIIVVVVAILWDVLARQLTGQGIRGTVEITEIALIFSVYLTLGGTHLRGGHVGMTLVLDKLSSQTRAKVAAVSDIPLVAFLGWMAIMAGISAWESYVSGEVRFGLLALPLWPARAALFIGLLLLIMSYVARPRMTEESMEDSPVGV